MRIEVNSCNMNEKVKNILELFQKIAEESKKMDEDIEELEKVRLQKKNIIEKMKELQTIINDSIIDLWNEYKEDNYKRIVENKNKFDEYHKMYMQEYDEFNKKYEEINKKEYLKVIKSHLIIKCDLLIDKIKEIINYNKEMKRKKGSLF